MNVGNLKKSVECQPK